jgi:serine/threonine protein kinase
MKSLSHPNIVKYYNSHETSDSAYIIMELLDGQPINDFKKSEKWDIDDIKKVTKTLVEVLIYFNSKSIIHRDLKPDNILVINRSMSVGFRNNLEIKIIDFGLAAFTNENRYIYMRCGTPGFAAPEVLNTSSKGKVTYDSRCDVYSIGVIFHYLNSGNIPFNGDTFNEIVAKNRAGIVNYRIAELQDMGMMGTDLLKKMLAVYMEDRFTAEQCASHPYFFQENITVNKRVSNAIHDLIQNPQAMMKKIGLNTDKEIGYEDEQSSEIPRFNADMNYARAVKR